MGVILHHSMDLPENTSRVLIAADVRRVDDVRAILANLPARTRGQIFIEVASADEIEVVPTPELITLAWLVRADRSGAPGSGERCLPGAALERAARAWVSEMATGDTDLDGGVVTAWVLGDSAWADALRAELFQRLGAADHVTH